MEFTVATIIFCVIFSLSVFLSKCNNDGDDETTEAFPLLKCEEMLPLCACFDYEVIAGLSCENLTDFQNFTTTLTNGELFEVNTTYEISLSGLTSLPAKCMQGLIVFRLSLDDPDTEEINNKAFDGAIRLRIFHVRQSSIKNTPDFRVIRDSLRQIFFENSLLTALEGTDFQDLYLLESLSLVNNSISRIDADAFKGTDGIRIFDISYNNLQVLPSTLFNTWENISKVVLSHNQLVHVDQLFAITHPKFIFLEFNNLTNLDTVLHPNMEKVETLYLGSNLFEKVSEVSFNGKVPNVRFLYLDHCPIDEFDVRHYSQLSHLATLDFSYTRITKIAKQTVEFGSSLQLSLIGNGITEFNAELTYTVKRLYLQDNDLRALGATLTFTQLVEVSIARNKLQYLSKEDFRGVHGMANVELQSNEIQWIDWMTFWIIRNDLHYLDLSDNLIRSLNGSLKFLSQLKSLNMSQNQLQYFQEGEFTGLNELAELYLEHNQIKELGGYLQLIPELRYLVIKNNHIQTLYPEQVPKKLQYLTLADNPLQCDCKMLPFLRWLKAPNSPGTDISLCAHVDTNTSTHPCPSPCICSCTEDRATHFMTLDCSFQNMSAFPPLLFQNEDLDDENSLIILEDKHLVLDLSDTFGFQIHDQVLGVNLENNSFVSLENIKLPRDLRHLRLANNMIGRLSDSLLYSFQQLTEVTLSGNPWECDCEAVGYKKWLLSKVEVVLDLNKTLCSGDEDGTSHLNGKLIHTLTDLDLCPINIMIYIAIALILTFLLLCASLKIVYTRHEYSIKVWLYAHGVTWVKEKDIDKDKKYDAFISFSNHDYVIYSEVIRIIQEEKPNVRLCRVEEHFKGGAFVHDNIINAVNSSKRTICLISEKFLKSEWCLFEFEVAYAKSIEDKINRIIVVKIGDLPEDLPKNIRMYMGNTTYIDWGNSGFWRNLLYVLPENCSNSFSVDSKQNPGMVTMKRFWV